LATRKALLIGADQYGEGFAALPAVRRDVELADRALQATGYETEICPELVVANATQLDSTIREFCRSERSDIRIVYFTGHGLRADGKDWIVPRGASRRDAAVSVNQRVSTDLSATVAESDAGMVLFIVDACRAPEDVPTTKGGDSWGDASGIARPGEPRFVRFFGCAANELCQVLPEAPDAAAASLFTTALSESLLAKGCATLDDLITAVQRRCTELLGANPQLQRQTPHLSFGETSADSAAMLKRPVFDLVADGALASVWSSFDPDKLHCLVLQSEYATQHANEWGVLDLATEALAGQTGDRIWKVFRAARNGQRLANGRRRALPVEFTAESLAFGSFSVLDAYAGVESFERAIRAIVEADLVIVDVTGFEPGVMLLAGVRSASRRGLCVSSHGAGWQEGQPQKIPFNLQDLNLNSHSASTASFGSNDAVIDRFVQRVESGFEQLVQQPNYLDLPGYDALRQLGSDYSASSTINVNDRILVLCSYDKDFRNNWDYVAGQLKKSLSARNIKPKKIERIIDYGTPQLVLQGLYEQIRRTAACVVDWSEYRASVFLELGARLAASEWGAVQIVDSRHAPGGESASELSQVERMMQLLKPVVYRYRGASSVFDQVAEALSRGAPNVINAAAPGFNRVYHVLLGVIDSVQEVVSPVAHELSRHADALHHPKQGQTGAPQILYSGSRSIKLDAERSAVERRVAAWLYLEYRVGAAARKADAELADLYETLGKAAKDGLFDLDDDNSIALALQIEARLAQKD
jgi:Caspase domain